MYSLCVYTLISHILNIILYYVHIGKNYDSQMVQLDKELLHTQELVYNAEYQIQQIERKIARGLGQRSNEEKAVLNNQLIVIEVKLTELKEAKKVLSNQLRKLTLEYNTTVQTLNNITTNNTTLNNKLIELELENRMLSEQMNKQYKEKDEALIQNDLLKLEIVKLRESLAVKTDKVYNLQNNKLELLIANETAKQVYIMYSV